MVITQKEYDKTKKKKIEISNEKLPTNPDSDLSPTEVNQLYAIVKSDTYYGAYYLITDKGTKCSCPGKNCKHLREIQNGNRACIRITRSVSETNAEHNRGQDRH